MHSVHDDQAAWTNGVLAQHLHAVAPKGAIGRCVGEVVHSDNDVADAIDGDEPLLFGIRFTKEVDVAWIAQRCAQHLRPRPDENFGQRTLISRLSKEVRSVITSLVVPQVEADK